MKVPLVWVKKHPKLAPTTHCHPTPYRLSNSCKRIQAGDCKSSSFMNQVIPSNAKNIERREMEGLPP